MCESKRKTMNKILRNAEETRRNISKFEIETYEIFGEDWAALTLAPIKTTRDVSTVVRACFLSPISIRGFEAQFHLSPLVRRHLPNV